MASTIILIMFYLLCPAAILYLSARFAIVKKVGVVMLAYMIGMLLAVSGILPENALTIQDEMAGIAVPLALPLLLFSLNIRNWVKLAGKTFLSLLSGLIALVIVIFSGYYLFRDAIPEAWKVSGLLIGVYTGGTPNMASIKEALDVASEVYIVAHTLDTVFSLIYIVFLVTVAQRVFSLILPKFQSRATSAAATTEPIEDIENFAGIFSKPNRMPLLIAFGIAVLILAVGGAASILLPKDIATMVAILLITTLGIALSMVPYINRIQHTFKLGMYLILVFCVIVASMVNLDNLLATSPALIAYVFMGVFGTLLLHILISAIFRIDTDTTIICSTAMICSPPFVPVVAAGIRNKEVIISGLSVGIIGYAIGNYLGIATALFLK